MESNEWIDDVRQRVGDLQPGARELLIHILQFQELHDLSRAEFTACVREVIRFFAVALTDVKKRRD